MKTKLLLSALLVIILASCVLFSLCVSAEKEVDRIFDAERIMQFDEGTRFENGIVNGGIINPGIGKYSTYAGIKFDKATHLGENAVKVELLEGKTTGFFDFNYYQWDATAKKPAIDGSRYSYMKIRFAYDNEDKGLSNMKFWASKETKLGTTVGEAYKRFAIVNSEDGWSEAVVRIDSLTFGDGTSWSQSTVRQFRIYMFEGNTDPDAVCYVAGFGFFETEEEACGYDFKTGKQRPIVSYNANGGVGAPKMQAKEFDKPLKLTENLPGRSGHRFLGWATSPDGTVKYLPGDYYSENDSERLYAIWEPDADTPVGDHIFNAERIMQFDRGTHFRNGFVNGAVKSPFYGLYYIGQGVSFTEATYNGEPAVKVGLLDSYVEGYLDFNYYAYDETEGYKPALDGGKYPYLKIKYAYVGVSDVYYMSIFASKAMPDLGTVSNGEKMFGIEHGAGEWREAVVDLRDFEFGDRTTWEDNIIRQFRVKMFLGNRNPGAVCYIAGIGFFETKEEAEAYDFASGGFYAETEIKTETAGTDDLLTGFIDNNQLAVGIVIGCIIGVIITVIVVAVVVNVSLKKRY